MSTSANDPTPLERVTSFLLDTDENLLEELEPDVADEVPGNASKQIVALALQKAGDLVVDAKTVLPWLLTSLGVPAAFIGLLVPIRESGSMLPQAALTPTVRRQALRKWLWVAGAAGQAISVAAIAILALTTQALVAGIGILVALAVFAIARSLSSLSSKDVLGRTIPKGARGRVTGLATAVSGGVAILVGGALRIFGGEESSADTLALLVGASALAWVAAGTVYARIVEPPGETDQQKHDRPLATAWSLLRQDHPFRRFVMARTLLLVSALAPPFVVALATQQGGSALSGLGPFVISSGLAALIGGRLWGSAADRSSRLTMAVGAASASLTVLLYLVLLRYEPVAELSLLHPVVYLLLALSHTGVRVGRKTFVVDLAKGNRRTDYVAVSNSAMGLLLLVAGAVTSGVAVLGPEPALLLLAILGLVGVGVARSLPEVNSGHT